MLSMAVIKQNKQKGLIFIVGPQERSQFNKLNQQYNKSNYLMNTPHRMGVDSMATLCWYVKKKISAGFHVISMYFFLIISMSEKIEVVFDSLFSTYFRGQKKLTSFGCTFFNLIYMGDKSTFRCNFDRKLIQLRREHLDMFLRDTLYQSLYQIKLDIIPLPLAKSICLQTDFFLLKIWLEATNGFARHVMDLWTVWETKIVESRNVLILHLLQLDNFKGAVIKYNMGINCCSETLRLTLSADGQMCLFKEFNLKAIISHSGTLQAGHYWAHIKD